MHLQQKFIENVGKNGPIGVLQRVYKNTISAPKLADYLVHLFRTGPAWCMICISGLLFQPFWISSSSKGSKLSDHL